MSSGAAHAADEPARRACPATSAPSAAASRAASAGLRRPANGARAGIGSGPAGAPARAASVARRFASRRSRVTGPGDELGGHATAAGRVAAPAGARARAERREQPQRERLAVDLGLEARAGAGRAAGVARAGAEQVRRPVDQLVVAREQPLRQPDAAGHRLVQVDRRRLVVRRADLRDEAEVARVDHQQHRGHRLDRPPGADQRDVELVAPPAGRARPRR